MSEMLQNSVTHDAVVLFLLVFLEQAGLPIPAAPWLIAAGARCATAEASLVGVIAAATLASFVADLAWFCLGRWTGRRLLHFLGRLALPSFAATERIERSFTRYGMLMIIISKFVPGLSVVVPPLAGALKIELRHFMVFDLLGSVLYAGFYLLIGIIFAEQVRPVLELLGQFGLGALLILAALFIAYLVSRHAQRKTVFDPIVGRNS